MGSAGTHDVDRALNELLQELRVTQTAGQVFFGFLFSVGFTPVFQQADGTQRALYAGALGAVTASMIVLVMPVATHRASFGMRNRPRVLAFTHSAAAVGLALLGIGVVLGVALLCSFALPAAGVWLPTAVAALVLLCWVFLPLVLRAQAPGVDAGTGNADTAEPDEAGPGFGAGARGHDAGSQPDPTGGTA